MEDEFVSIADIQADLDAAIAAEEAELADAEATQAATAERIKASKARLAERMGEREFFRQIVERHPKAKGVKSYPWGNRDAEPMVGARIPINDTRPWGEISQHDAILRMLRREAVPLPPQQLVDLLNAEGRSDKIQSVRNHLTDMRQKREIVSLGIGKWTLPDLVPEGVSVA